MSAVTLRWLLSALLLCALPMAGAGASFGRDWKSAGLTNPVPNTIEGRWEGRWVSSSDSHRDKLRCLITKQEDGTYLARFQSYYFRIFTFSHDVSLKVVSGPGGTNQFSGSSDLGRMAGGVFTYNGHATATNFFSHYNSKKYRGVFEMTRPAPPPPK